MDPRGHPGLVLALLAVSAAAPLRAGDADPLRERLKGARGTTEERERFKKRFETRCVIGCSKGGSAFLLDSFVPVHLWIKNNTKYIFEGTLRCRVQDRRRQHTYNATYETPVILAGRGSAKHIMLHVYAPDAALGAVLGAGARGGSFRVGLYGPAGLPFNLEAPATYNLQRKSPVGTGDELLHRELVLILSQHLRQLPQNRPIQGRTVKRTCVSADVEYLPRRWIGYTGVHAVVWEGIDLSRMEHHARSALRDYVTAGGHLVIAVGEHRSRLLQSAFLKRLLPCHIGPQERCDLGRSLLGAEGRPPAVVTRLTPEEGARVIRRDRDGTGLPLVVRQDLGAGTVTVVAFSLASSFCSKRTSLTPDARQSEAAVWDRWRKWIDPVLSPPVNLLQAQTGQMLRQTGYRYLKQSATKRIPSHQSIFAFLVVYLLVLVPLTYMIFRGWQRLELAWTTTPLVALLFFAGSYWVAFRHLEKNLSITNFTIARFDPSGVGGDLTLSLLHNPPNYATYDLTFADPGRVPLYLRADSLPGETDDKRFDHTFSEIPDHEIRLNGFWVGFNDKRVMESSGSVRLGQGLRARVSAGTPLRDQRPRVFGSVDNRTGLYLSDIALVWGTRGIVLAPVPPEDAVPLQADADEQPLAIRKLVERLCGRASPEPTLPPLVLCGLDMLVRGANRPHLVGLASVDPVTWQVAGKEAPSNGLTLFAVPCSGPLTEPIEFAAPSDRRDAYGGLLLPRPTNW